MKKVLIVLVLALLVGGGIYAKKTFFTRAKAKFDPVSVSEGPIEVAILATGTVQSQNRLEIKPPVAGRIDEVLIRPGKHVRKGEILAWMSSTERVALLDAARAKGKEEVKRWGDTYKSTPIIAPLSGTLISRNVEPGQTVTVSDVVLIVSDRLIVKANVDETDIAQVKVGQNSRIILDAYANRPLPAKVGDIAFDSKTVNNVTTYIVDVVPGAIPDYMRSGMTANVSFLISRQEKAVLLPTDAIQRDDGVTFVMVPAEDGAKKPERKEIELGITDGKNTQVVKGLEAGDTVLRPVFELPSAGGQGANPFMPGMRNKGGKNAKGARGVH